MNVLRMLAIHNWLEYPTLFMHWKSQITSTNNVTSLQYSWSLTCNINSWMVPVLPSLDPSLIFPFQLLPSPVNPTGFSFCFFLGFLAILSCCHRTTTTRWFSYYLLLYFLFISYLLRCTLQDFPCNFYLLAIEYQQLTHWVINFSFLLN